MALFLGRRGDQVQITEEVVKVDAVEGRYGNPPCSNDSDFRRAAWCCQPDWRLQSPPLRGCGRHTEKLRGPRFQGAEESDVWYDPA